MKLSRCRRALVATTVVCGSVLTGVGLGTFLTRIVLAGDRPRTGAVAAGSSILAGGTTLPVIHAGAGDLSQKPPVFLPGFTTVQPLPTFSYQVTADPSLGGGTYAGTIIGGDPTSPIKGTTRIPVPIVPLIITINDGKSTVTYDPTVADGCVAGGHTDVELVEDSPLFQNLRWTINGVNVGNTQYISAFQRAQFWSLVRGSNYELIFEPTLLPAQVLTFAGPGTVGVGSNNSVSTPYCANASVGVVNIKDLDLAIYGLITGPLANAVNPGTLPVFLVRNVVSAVGGHNVGPQCCVIGFHGAFASNNLAQVYSTASFETTGAFGPNLLYAAPLSHELGEAVNDPYLGNLTPKWGYVGQVSHCQDDLEVGDPLTGTSMPPVVGPNGFSYRMQELAFFSWFYGGNAPLGAGGVHSSNGTFQGIARLCPPGGTN